MNPREYDLMHILNRLKEQSWCLDKQVACVIVDEYLNILSFGVNYINNCNKDCHNKATRICNVLHAEVVAVENLHKDNYGLARKAYVNLFPCVACQERLMEVPGIEEIVVFGPKHKGQVFENIRLERDLYADLIDTNGKDKQLSVAQGELAELITAVSDYFYRRNDKRMENKDFIDELVDVELMLDQLKKIAWAENTELYNGLRRVRNEKYADLSRRINKGVL